MTRCRRGAGRLMSVAHTVDAVMGRSKTVTRRPGWTFLTAGDRLQLVKKAMGLPKGAHPVVVANVVVVDVRRERLDAIDLADVAAEGFDGWSASEFVEFYCSAFGVGHGEMVTRVEWVYLDVLDVDGWAQPCLPGIA